jgi:hypothetical protein
MKQLHIMSKLWDRTHMPVSTFTLTPGFSKSVISRFLALNPRILSLLVKHEERRQALPKRRLTFKILTARRYIAEDRILHNVQRFVHVSLFCVKFTNTESFTIIYIRIIVAEAQLVQALRYKPEGRGFDSR